MNYKDLIISPENIKEEKETFAKVCEFIDKKQSIVFDAGAGSGKTYSLIESLKYIIKKYGLTLKNNKQKILCVTYTNVAAAEIKERLGNTSLVEVSTIHEYAWKIIKPYQKQLVQIHKKKIECTIDEISNDLLNKDWANAFKMLDNENKDKLINLIVKNKDIYYEHRNDNAAQLRSSLKKVENEFPNLMSNVGKFKKVSDRILHRERLQHALKKIQAKDSNYKNVDYDTKRTTDKLESMKISHDTLLEYTKVIIQENEILRKIICDKYPYVLVDEYQDTDVKVVNTLGILDKYSKEKGHAIFVGYFGDVRQNIYDKGVGSSLNDNHENLQQIKKIFNRRSSTKIIEIANKIRNDTLEQKTIYENFPKGNVEFYNLTDDSVEHIVSKFIEKWDISEKNELHCLELTNKLVANGNGLSNIYNFFETSGFYNKGNNYKKIADEILSRDRGKLGSVPNLLVNIEDLRYKINHKTTMIKEIVNEKMAKDMNIIRLRELIALLKDIKGNTLKEFISNMFSKYKKGYNYYDNCIEYLIGNDIKSYEDIENFILNELFLLDYNIELNEDYINESKGKVKKFLEIDIEEFDRWYEYLINNNVGKVMYHTYHGTKGLEFDNVIIFMRDKFGRDKNYFSRLFINLFSKDKTMEKYNKIEEARNLLYVAITRARLNLSIIYNGDITKFEEQINSVFGEVKYIL